MHILNTLLLKSPQNDEIQVFFPLTFLTLLNSNLFLRIRSVDVECRF